jgi:hypothetical protein
MAICTALSGNCSADETWTKSVSISSTLAFYSQSASTTYSRDSYDLLEASGFSKAQLRNISTADIFISITAFFGVPAQKNSQTIDEVLSDLISWTNEYFFQYIEMNDTASIEAANEGFRTLLTLPFLWFQPNVYGPTGVIPSLANTTLTGLPASMTVTAHFAEGKGYVALAPWTAIAYLTVVIIGVVIPACLFFANVSIPTIKSGSFHAIDIASRLLSSEVKDDTLADRVLKLSTLEDKMEIEETLVTTRVFLRSVKVSVDDEGKDEVIGFITDEKGGERLKKNKLYLDGGMYARRGPNSVGNSV